MDRGDLEKLMSALQPRVFLMRNAKEDAPCLMKTRWTLSYLRGPLTGPEISRLMAPRKQAAKAAAAGVVAAGGAVAAASVAARSDAARPPLPPQIREYFLPAVNGAGAIEYRPMVLGAAKLHFVDAKLGVDAWQTLQNLAPLSDEGRDVLWAEAKDIATLRAQATNTPAPSASFATLAGTATRADSYAAWGKALSAHLYETARADMIMCDALKQASNPGETEGDFRTRLGLRLREERDAQVERLRAAYAPKLAALQDRMATAKARAEREQSQLTHQKFATAISVGATIFSAFLGKKALSATSMGRAATAVRSATRIGAEKQDVDRANESAAVVEQKIQDLSAQCEAEIKTLSAQLDPAAIVLRTVQLAPRKSDIAVGEIALAWQPWRTGADGFPAPAC
jgi:hypothetical protein